ncbi:hypothetical protein L195_g060780, partial [Trifolium pratense]
LPASSEDKRRTNGGRVREVQQDRGRSRGERERSDGGAETVRWLSGGYSSSLFLVFGGDGDVLKVVADVLVMMDGGDGAVTVMRLH